MALGGSLAACSPAAPAQENFPNASTPPPVAMAGPQWVRPAPGEPQQGLDQGTMRIDSANGAQLFSVALARTPEQQEIGLMFRRSLRPDEGMFFPYEPPQDVAFWMKNTLIPLDLVFVDSDWRIARISHGQALSLDPIPSGVPVVGVLEIGSGRAAQLGLRVGDKVTLTDSLRQG